jgi:uncharacterized protein YjbI with pentapeptide repeats
MAIDDLVALLKQGPQAWNPWRATSPEAPVDLSHGALRGLALEGVDLTGADLTGADLRGADLRNASLVGARLGRANLFKADLAGADLNEADVRGALFLQCPQLESARNWQSAYRDNDLACGAPIPGC